MGLFSSKKKTYVYTSVSRMVEDEDIIPSNKLAVMDYVTGPNANSTSLGAETISDYLIRATENNIVARARKIQKFLSQAFFVAELFTGTPGQYVPLKETIRGFKEILEGKHDDLPEGAFYMVGTIDDAVAKAATMKD